MSTVLTAMLIVPPVSDTPRGTKPGNVTVIFHDPIDPKQFADPNALMLAVRQSINAGLPLEYRDANGPVSVAVAEP